MRSIRHAILLAGFLVVTLGGIGFGVGCSGNIPGEGPIPLAVVSGRVTHVLTGVPLAGVVTITPSGAPPVEVAVAANGTYTRGALSVGPARIEARATGFRDYSANVTLNTGNNTHDIQLIPN